MNNRIRATGGMLAATALYLLVVTACQQQGLDIGKQRYQQQSSEVLRSFASDVSHSFRGVSSGRRVRANHDQGGDWQDWGHDPYGGSLFEEDPSGAVSTCLGMIRQIPLLVETYRPRMSTLIRCLTRYVNQDNLMFYYMAQNLDGGGRDYLSYLENFHRPVSFDQTPSSDLSLFLLFALGGQGFGGGP